VQQLAEAVNPLDSVPTWRSERRFDDLGTYRSHHLVEGSDELRVPVTD
jgi:hypothetical protein